MKKNFIALAAFGTMISASYAQSSVTLYGVLDANLSSFQINGVTGVTAATPTGTSVQNLRQTKIDSAGVNGSRWGLRIREDLGGGMAVIGNLESGFNIDTGASGQGGLLFGRRANVGVSSSSFGTLEIGRNSSAYEDVAGDHAMMGASFFDPAGVNNGPSAAQASTLITSAASTATFLSRDGKTWIGYNTRFNNSVKYTSPAFSGFSGSVMYAFGEDGTQAVSASKTVSANLKYVNGPLLVSGGYQSEGATRTATTQPALKNTMLNVAYDFGMAKVGLGLNRAKFEDVVAPAALGGGNIAAQKGISLSIAVPVGATTVSAGVASSTGDTLGKSTGFGVQALYSLSKRTTLYAGAVSIKAYDKLAAATLVAFPTSNVGRTETYALGIRHTF
jgi:predicted porin